MLFSVPNSTRTCGKRLLKHLLRSNTKSTNTDLRLGSQYLSINKVLDLDCLHLCRNYCSSASLKVNRSPVLKYLENVLKQYDEANSKVRDQLRPLVHLIEERQDILTSIAGLDELKTGEDKELKSLADEERQVYEEELELVDRQLLLELAPRNKHEDYDDVIMEVSCGAGGQEAMLFAAELLNMYEGYASYKGWRFEAIEVNRSDLGGIKSSTAMVKGKNTYKSLQYEIGVHRVQRTPATEKSGRIHTSTAAVVVMPQPTEVDITINDSDLVFETMRAGGPGGQHVNKTESAVRLTHLPSGIVIESKSDRSQIRNRELAVVKLRAQLFAIEQDKRTSEAQSMRQQQVGNRDRSEKIRTYNFNQDRITDHRASGNMHDISSFMEGGASLDRLIEKLQQVDQEKRLADFLSSLR